jgi:hypothetical protein
MIHKEAVKPEMLDLLLAFMKWPEVSDFCLVGGTSITLRFGYRESDDIDLFTAKEYDSRRLKEGLNIDFPSCEIVSVSKGSITAFARGIKIDILQHLYKTLAPVELLDGIRFCSLRDISAMKINAVSQRGSKKDFSDLLFLSNNGISLEDSLHNYQEKYGAAALFPAIKSLTYFEDTRGEPDPRYRNAWTWEEVRKRMEKLGKEIQRDFSGRTNRPRRDLDGYDR